MPDMRNQSTENHSPKKVVIIGAGGHGRVIADIVSLSGDVVSGFLDDKDPSEFPNITILGKLTDIERFKQEAFFIVGIGNNQLRKQIMETFDVDWYTAIHPTAVITSDVVIGEGTAIMANAVINTGSKLGRGVIVNTAATVDHDNVLEDYVHVSPGVHLGGTVHIGSETWIGIGAVVINNIDICEECVIGAGALVIHSIMLKGVYIGVPAKISVP
jgi:sugar O-acyltransferase (sialic acid O-acetyltransferase NeuD family)